MKKTIKPKVNTTGLELISSATFLTASEDLHRYGKKEKVICITDKRGHLTPENASPERLVVDSSEGFIPLWAKDVTLHWRFNRTFGKFFNNPEAAKQACRNLLGEAILKWDDACPLRFKENEDTWDFEIRMAKRDCDNTGCTLAAAFFPGPGRNTLYFYPTLFEQTRNEQIETLVHELGHIFGLRHFFAQLSEAGSASEVFGTHNSRSIMNYGAQSVLTKDDIRDLINLYQMVWSGELKAINGTRIKLFKAYHASI